MTRKDNPETYRVAVTSELYDRTHELWLREAPIHDI